MKHRRLDPQSWSFCIATNSILSISDRQLIPVFFFDRVSITIKSRKYDAYLMNNS